MTIKLYDDVVSVEKVLTSDHIILKFPSRTNLKNQKYKKFIELLHVQSYGKFLSKDCVMVYNQE
jgi:hypothetical protein